MSVPAEAAEQIVELIEAAIMQRQLAARASGLQRHLEAERLLEVALQMLARVARARAERIRIGYGADRGVWRQIGRSVVIGDERAQAAVRITQYELRGPRHTQLIGCRVGFEQTLRAEASD